MWMEKVTDGLYEVASTGVNVFLIDDPESGLILIDTGMPWSKGAILKAIAELGKQPSDLKHILLTHADIDHVGCLGALVRETGAQTYAGSATADYAHRKQSPPHVPMVMILLSKLLFAMMTTPHIDHRLADGEMIDVAGGIQAIHTPGHTPDNFSYYWERGKVLFAADLLNTAFSDGLGLSPKMMTHSVGDTITSARKVLMLDPEFICVGHGKFVSAAKQPELIAKLRSEIA